MKTATLSTPTHDILLVELPEKARDHKLFGDKDRPYISYFEGIETKRFYIPQGGWTDLGFVADLKESDVEPFVHPVTTGESVQYVASQEDYHNGNLHTTALESFLSLLETKVYWENPYDKPEKMGKLGNWNVFDPYYGEALENFEEAQSRTFDRARTIVMVKEKCQPA